MVPLHVWFLSEIKSLTPKLTKNTLPQGEPGTGIAFHEFLLAAKSGLYHVHGSTEEAHSYTS